MKKTIILLFVIAVTGNLFSQSLKILDTNNVDISNTIVTVNGIVPDGTVFFYAHVQNTSGQSIQTLVCKEVVSENGLIANNFCFGPHCYSSDTANFPVNIAVGGIDSSFDASIIVSGVGISQIIYTFFDKNNTSDKVSVTVNYDIALEISFADNVGNFLSNPYPVPATNFIKFDYNFNQDAQLVVYDITGKIVSQTVLKQQKQQIKISVENFHSGIYYYSLLINNKKKFTNKFVVN